MTEVEARAGAPWDHDIEIDGDLTITNMTEVERLAPGYRVRLTGTLTVTGAPLADAPRVTTPAERAVLDAAREWGRTQAEDVLAALVGSDSAWTAATAAHERAKETLSRAVAALLAEEVERG